MNQDVARLRFQGDAPQDLLHRYTHEMVVEQRPARHTVDVAVDGLLWKSQEIRPAPRGFLLDQAETAKSPRGHVDARRGPVGEYRPFLGRSLAWRDPVSYRRIDLPKRPEIAHCPTPRELGNCGFSRRARATSRCRGPVSQSAHGAALASTRLNKVRWHR